LSRRDRVLEELGLTPLWVRRNLPSAAPVPVGPGSPVAQAPAGRETAVETRPAQSMDWAELKAAVSSCTRCGLHRARTQTVFGVGDEKAEWLFIGEGPGAEEDARGEPFVGQAGKLLDNMLAAIGLKRGDNVYIANIVKCRPPGNRNPEPGEAHACEPYLSRQIELIRPRMIVALGKVSAQNLLGAEATIASLRGRVHRYRDIPLVVTYHPAYLLRNLADKARSWEDLCFAVETMRALKAQATAPT
jgi:uracil-DNA glycosylase